MSRKRILVTLTSDYGKFLSGIHDIHIGGACDIKDALLVAKLALANRINKIHTQRIILFVGSPIKCNLVEFESTLNELKKSNIAIDVVSFGEVTENNEILEAIPRVFGEDGTTTVVPPGEGVLLDMLGKTEIFKRDGGLRTFDPEYDPELAAAMQASLADGGMGGMQGGYDEEAALRAALEASLMTYEDQMRNQNNQPQQQQQEQPKEQQPQHEEGIDDEELRMAIEMSMQDQNNNEKKDEEKKDSEEKK